MSRARSWHFVINNYTEECMNYVLSMKCKYLVVGHEVGEEGTPHLQGYVSFSDAKTRKAVSALMPRANLRVAKGSAEQNLTYCSKDGSWYEFGKMPESGKITWERMEEVMENPKDNISLFNQYRKSYDLIKRSERKEHLRCLYIIDHKRKWDIECDDVCYSDVYNGEKAVYYPYVNMFKSTEDDVEAWIRGHPPNYKYGYEILKWDPEVVYIGCAAKHIGEVHKKWIEHAEVLNL